MQAEWPPEAADGGWWYVVPTVPDPDYGGHTPGHVPGDGWTATYGQVNGTMYAAVRTPEPVVGMPTVDVPVSAVLEAAGYQAKPYGRINGR